MRIVIEGNAEDMEELVFGEEGDLVGLPITRVVISWEDKTPEQQAFAQLTVRRVTEKAERRGCRVIYATTKDNSKGTGT